jgi:hypothetical protein
MPLPPELDARGSSSSQPMSSPVDPLELPMPPAPPPPLQWRSWPLRENVPGAILVFGGLVGAGAGVRWVTGQTHLALLAVAVLALALWRFFMPTLYELNIGGVNQWLFGRHRRIPWREIRHYEVQSSGVLLLPRAEPCPMDAFRGLYLPWGKRRDEVLAQVRYYLDQSSKA